MVRCWEWNGIDYREFCCVRILICIKLLLIFVSWVYFPNTKAGMVVGVVIWYKGNDYCRFEGRSFQSSKLLYLLMFIAVLWLIFLCRGEVTEVCFASKSACSLPCIPLWLGTHRKLICFSEKWQRYCRKFRIVKMRGEQFLCTGLVMVCNAKRESEIIRILCFIESFLLMQFWIAKNIAVTSASYAEMDWLE